MTSSNLKILAIIPARGGSKSVPKKNIRNLNGKPLIAHTIDAVNTYVKDKISISRKDTLRGIHGDFETTKLITCVHGEVYSVIVDNRKNSDTYKEWFWNIFTHHNRNIMILPPGVGLSYLILSEEATILYKWSYPNEYPDIDKQFTLRWNDEELNIYWPIQNPVLQPRDM